MEFFTPHRGKNLRSFKGKQTPWDGQQVISQEHEVNNYMIYVLVCTNPVYTLEVPTISKQYIIELEYCMGRFGDGQKIFEGVVEKSFLIGVRRKGSMNLVLYTCWKFFGCKFPY